jgi:hypothetical protein
MVCEGSVRIHRYFLLFVIYQLNNLRVNLLVRYFGPYVHRNLEELEAHVASEFPAQVLAHFGDQALELLQEEDRIFERVVFSECSY